MYRTKKEVDKHVSDILSKVQNENDKQLKGFPIARLYFQIKDYEMSKRYLAGYLNVRETHAPSHKLMGQTMEALGNPEFALHSYKRSLDIDVHQKDLVLKICELYCNLPIDPDTARYWADRADKLFPHHEVIFRLRECIVNAEGEPNLKELEQLITSEMNSRPKDVNLYTKLLKLYTDTERVEEAYIFAAQVETSRPFPFSIDWYYCLADIFEAYQEENPQLKVQFCLEYFVVLDHLSTLLLAETHALSTNDGLPTKHGRSVANAAAVLYSLDKLLHRACLQTSLSQDPSWIYVKNQMHGQLYLHLGTLLLKRAKKERANWKEACRYSSALYLLAYTFKPGSLQQEAWFCKMDSKRQFFLDLQQKGFLRLSHTGHVLMSMCSVSEERPHWLQRVKQEICVPQAQEKIFQRAFSSLQTSSSSSSREKAQNASRQGQSYFLQDTFFLKANLQFPTHVSLLEYDRVSNKVYPYSLHHLVWLSIHWLPPKRHSKIPKFQVFEKLQLSSALLGSGAPESLCQLDVEAFLSATVFTAWGALEMRGRSKTPAGKAGSFQVSLLGVTPDICDPLCTPEQAAWWRAAYGLYSNNAKEKLGELRQILKQGLETIRGVGAHGMEISLVVHLARHFAQQAQLLRETLGKDTPSEEVSVMEERANHYWNLSLTILDKQQSGTFSTSHGGSSKFPPLFASFRPELSAQEVLALGEEGRFYLACRLLNTGCLEEAVEAFAKLNSADSSHHQATALVQLSRQPDLDGDVRAGLLGRARDSLYLTLDRVGADKRHPLNLQLHEEIEAVELKLAYSQNNGIHEGSESGLEEEEEEEGDTSNNISSVLSPLRGPILTNNNSLREMLNLGSPAAASVARNLNLNNGSLLDTSLNSNSSFRARLRPSPERLDAQIRALSYNQCGVVQLLLEQQRTLMETNKAIVEELRQNKNIVEELKKKLDEMQTFKCNHVIPPVRQTPVVLPTQQRNLVHRTQPMRSAIQNEDENENEEFEETGHPDPGHLYDYSLDPEEAGFDYNSYLHDPRSTSNMGYAMMMQYPAHYAQPPHIAATIPPQALLNQRPPPPRSCYPGYGTALTFSEGQQLPQFNFRMPPPAVAIPPMGGINPVPDSRSTVFNRLGPNSGMIPQPPMWENQALPPPQQDMQWNAKMGSSAPNAFQIPLPAANLPSDQPPAILSSVAALPSFMSPQMSQTPEHSNVLKGMLTGTPSNMPTAASTSHRSPLETFQGFSMTPGNVSGVTSSAVGETSLSTSGHRDQSDNEEADIDFKPAIPLPDEVVVCTGEEQETVLFEQRAKLFRFTEKEWKERGVGILKILLDKNTGKVRLLMRRDQVLKVCANHHILSNMFLQPMKESDRAWIWAAQDFAEENLKEEKFCIRFKTQDLALEFKKAFESSVQRETQRLKEVVSSPIPQESIVRGFGDKFKPTTGSWTCDACLVNNKVDINRCVACETPKPGTESTVPAPSSKGLAFGGPPVSGGGFAGLFQAKSYTCSKCKVTTVVMEGEQCLGCKGTPFFGSTPNSGGVTPISGSVAKVVGKEPDKNIFGGFTFSSIPIIKSGSNDVTEEKSVVTPRKPARPIATAISKQKETPPVNVEKTNTSPFAAFHFSLKTQNKEPVTNLFSSTPVTTEEKVKTSHLFGQSSSETNLTFDSISTTTPIGFKADPNFRGFPGSGKQLFGATNTPGTPSAKTVFKESIEEFVPSAEFQPVIPLPELVDIKTGEEEEEKLFSERAKLFRFIVETKEWKERGIGEAKILKNPETNRCRVLMRRDQVLKLCANHIILPEMKLTPMQSSDRAWIWCAQDYSEGEMRQEQFAIKFKNKDIALNFQKVFEQCQSTSDSPKNSLVISNDSSECPKPAVVKSLATLFKPEEGSWDCTSCYIRNKKDANVCPACTTPKPGTSVSLDQPKFSFQSTGASSFQNPIQKCKFQFASGNSEVSLSNSPFKPSGFIISSDSGTKPTGFTFGSQLTDNQSQSFGSFTFGSANSQSAPVPITGDKTPPNTGEPLEFKFGSPQKFEFSFSGVRLRPHSPNKPSKSPGTPTDADKDGTEDELETSDADIFFQPVIPLPQKVDVKTGEEDEEVLYSHRAKLFRHDQGEWKERGTGDIKILRDNNTEKIRLLMRREQVLKVCLNHLLPLDLELLPKGDKSWFWSAMDFSEGSPHPEQLALRFKSKEVAEGFKQAVDDAKVYLRKPKGLETAIQLKATIVVPEEEKETQKAQSPVQIPSSPERVEKTEHTPATIISTPKPVTAETFSFISSSKASSSSKVSPSSFGLAARFGVAVSPGSSFVFGNAGSQQTLSPSATGTSYTFGSSSLTGGKSTTEVEKETTVTDLSVAKPKELALVQMTEDIQVLEEKSSPVEKKDLAESLQLPSNFYLYEDKDSCQGCRGCDEDFLAPRVPEEDIELTFVKKPSVEQAKRAKELMLPETFFFYEDAPPCPGCRGCWEEDLQKIAPQTATYIEQQPIKDEKLKPTIVDRFKSSTLVSQSPLFPQVSVKESSQSETPKTTVVYPSSTFLSSDAIPEFSFATLAAQNPGNDFAALAQSATSSPAFKSSGFSGFAGAGTPLFGRQVTSPKENAADDSQEVVEASVDVHFDPLVPLPELVELKTGEEEETAIFSQRARLYRFDSGLKQWKERGIGEMKILQHSNKCQFRLVLRRDQVLKIACNHLISPTLELKPLSASNDNSLMWSAMDFSEEVLLAEMFCIKFKNKDFLEDFRKKVEECKEILLQNVGSAESLDNGGLEDSKQDVDSEEVEDEEYEDEEDEEEEVPEWAREEICLEREQGEGEDEEEEEVPEWAREEFHVGQTSEDVSSLLEVVSETQALHLGSEETGEDRDRDNSEEAVDEDEEEEDEEQLMFEKRITLSAATMDSKEFKSLGMGTLRILYDDTIFGGRIQVTDDNSQLLCDHFIAVQTCLRVVDKEASWAAADMTLPQSARRQFKASFSSKAAAQDFEKAFDEAKHLSVQSEIVEKEDPTPNF